MTTKPGQKAHFFLACCEITFIDGEQNTGITRLNSVIRSESQTVGVLLMGRAQQAAQMQLIKNMNDSSIQALNVTFTSISYLGFQSDEEFHKTDEGVAGHG